MPPLDDASIELGSIYPVARGLRGRARRPAARRPASARLDRGIANRGLPEAAGAVGSGADAVPAAALVRPDGVLAWKSGEKDDEGAWELPRVMAAILDAEPAGGGS